MNRNLLFSVSIWGVLTSACRVVAKDGEVSVLALRGYVVVPMYCCPRLRKDVSLQRRSCCGCLPPVMLVRVRLLQHVSHGLPHCLSRKVNPVSEGGDEALL